MSWSRTAIISARACPGSASRFGQFTGPVRILWGADDPFFLPALGQRLSTAFPHATLTAVPGGRTFLPLDQPGKVADEIVAADQDAETLA